MFGRADDENAGCSDADQSREDGSDSSAQPALYGSDRERGVRSRTGVGSGRIRETSSGLELGFLSVASLALAGLQEVRAESGKDEFLDDGVIAYKDLRHGEYVLVTKELFPRVFVVDDPTTTVWLHPPGSGAPIGVT